MSKTTNITPVGKLSIQELKKSARDTVVVALAPAVVQIVEQLMRLLANTDFGEYSFAVSVVLAGLAPVINRYLSIIRVK